MLGAAHACANPLTARYGTIHGVAVAVLLPRVVYWNAAYAREGYAELLWASGTACKAAEAADRLAERVQDLAALAGLPASLRDLGVPREDLPLLAEEAAQQWTGTFNPRKLDVGGALDIYRAAF